MKNRGALLLFLFVLVLYSFSVRVRYEQGPHLPTFLEVDRYWHFVVVRSITEDQDLDLTNQLNGNPKLAHDQTAIGADGRWYPLHEPLMMLVSSPFYLLFGVNGLLYFNVLMCCLLMLMIYWITARIVDPLSAFSATAITSLMPLFMNYTYNYSLDVFGTLLLLFAYWAIVEEKFVLSGVCWGLAVIGRLLNVITLIAFLLFLYLAGRDRTNRDEQNAQSEGQGKTDTYLNILRPTILFVLGGSLFGLLFFLQNWHLFGSPFETGYHNWARLQGGELVGVSQTALFHSSFLHGLGDQLFNRGHGLVFGAPSIMIGVALGFRSFFCARPREGTFMLIICCSLLLFFSLYQGYPGDSGNRYLMALAALNTVPLSFAIKNCFAQKS